MSGRRGCRRRNGDVQETIEIDRAAGHEMFEGLTIEKFHGDERFAVLFADVVYGADIGMVERGSSLGFTLKTGQRLGVFADIIG